MAFIHFHKNNLLNINNIFGFFLCEISFCFFSLDTDDTKGSNNSLEESFKPLQVGITNPAASQQSGSASPNIPGSTFGDDGQRTSRPTSSAEQRDSSSRGLPSPDTAAKRTAIDSTSPPSAKGNQTAQALGNIAPIAPDQLSPTKSDYDQGFLIIYLCRNSISKIVFFIFRRKSSK